MILDPEPNSGVWNMAVDESLLESAVQSRWCTVRVYEWAEPTVSLGYFQRFTELEERLKGLPIVRRLTGGGAILHHRELTYSCFLPPGHPLTAVPTQIYTCVHKAVLNWLARLGVKDALLRSQLQQKELRKGEQRYEQQTPRFLCFGRGDPNDIVLDGSKILGSAQRRRRGAVLQHGSLLLERSEFAPTFSGLCDLRPELKPAELSKVSLGTEIAEALSNGPIVVEELSSEERQTAHKLLLQRYSSDAWTQKY